VTGLRSERWEGEQNQRDLPHRAADSLRLFPPRAFDLPRQCAVARTIYRAAIGIRNSMARRWVQFLPENRTAKSEANRPSSAIAHKTTFDRLTAPDSAGCGSKVFGDQIRMFLGKSQTISAYLSAPSA
jgi:hypothetical protein